MSSARIIYTPRPEVTPETELDVLCNVFRFLLFESSASKKVAAEPTPEPDGRNDGKKAKGDSACALILPETP